MAAETSFPPMGRRTRVMSRQNRLLSYGTFAAMAIVLGAAILYPIIVVLVGLFAP